MPKVGLHSLGTQATLIGAPVAHADMCSSGCWLPAATCAAPAVKPPCPWCVAGLWSSREVHVGLLLPPHQAYLVASWLCNMQPVFNTLISSPLRFRCPSTLLAVCR